MLHVFPLSGYRITQRETLSHNHENDKSVTESESATTCGRCCFGQLKIIFFSFLISMTVPLWSYITGVGYDLIKTTLNTATSAKAT